MTVVTRFAPSPTGFLHIGGARTALFNWLFARHHQGTFRLRVEDTDRERSTDKAVAAIIEGMEWLGLHHDGDIVYQFSRAARHAEVAHQLVQQGRAYYCYTSAEELEQLRQAAKEAGKPFRYESKWRHRDPQEAPEDVKPVIRLKAPQEGETLIRDVVQGDVVIANSQLDDMVLLRSDGTPTYMLAVVVDDHDMQVTHIIRGDDHLTNAARQTLLYQALDWEVPIFAHIPLIHGADGAKLSKRHGALGVDAYRDMGYLPEALRNYLLRLGWSHGNDEVISTAQAIEWFNLENIGRSPARFDFTKLENLNGIYIREAENVRLVELITPLLERKIHRSLSKLEVQRLHLGIEGLKQRAKTLIELADNAVFYLEGQPASYTEVALKALTEENKHLLQQMVMELEEVKEWDKACLEHWLRQFAEAKQLKLGVAAQALRSSITGSTVSPSMFEVMAILGKEDVFRRIRNIL